MSPLLPTHRDGKPFSFETQCLLGMMVDYRKEHGQDALDQWITKTAGDNKAWREASFDLVAWYDAQSAQVAA
jgi:hypothetical protein